MTTTTKESPAAKAPSEAKGAPREKAGKPVRVRKSPRAGSPWRRLWQVPLLVAGVTAFGFGMRALVRTIRPVPFATQAKGIRQLIANEKFDQAIEQINLMAEYYKEPLQQGELQELAGDTLFLGERKLEKDGKLVRKNYESAAMHYRQAVAKGIAPDLEMNERWAETALALGDGPTAEEKLEAAIGQATPEQAADLLRVHGKELASAYIEEAKPNKALETLDRILKAVPLQGEFAALQEAIELRTWCVCKRIEIALGMDKKNSAGVVEDAMNLARAEVDKLADNNASGRVLAWIGRVEYERGDLKVAERDLTEARSMFPLHHADDGRAAVVLGLIAEQHEEYQKAAGLFKEVIMGHAGTPLWPIARLGRAEVQTRTGVPLNDAMTADYQYAIATVKENAPKAPIGKEPELISRDRVRLSLKDGYRRAMDGNRTVEGLTFLLLEEGIGDRETPEHAYNLAVTREKRANEMAVEAIKMDGTNRVARELDARRMMALAAGDYLRHSKLTTLTDDVSGASLWKAGELLDRAGETARAIEVFKRIANSRPNDGRVSDALLAWGRLCESAGQIDDAIEIYKRNIKNNSKTPSSYASSVNLGRCYMLKGERAEKEEDRKAQFKNAEEVLLSLVEENPGVQPTAREFRDGLVGLADLYYQDHRWADAILRLDEIMVRYSADANWEGLPRSAFLLGESYRHSAEEIGEALKANAQMPQRNELNKARIERLTLAGQQFGRVIAMLDVEAMDGLAVDRQVTPLEAVYLRTSFMDRAQCAFDREDYEEAISLYDRTAARFSDEVIAVQAYVQIVNAYLAMKQTAQASAAAERGRWLLSRMPESAFANSPLGLNRAYFEKLLALGKT